MDRNINSIKINSAVPTNPKIGDGKYVSYRADVKLNPIARKKPAKTLERLKKKYWKTGKWLGGVLGMAVSIVVIYFIIRALKSDA